jgi:hypothetical protein
MAITAKIDAIDKDLSLFLKEELSPEARKAVMVSFAKEELAKAQAANRQALGYEPPYETFVDQRRGAALESINPDGGTILFAFELLDDLFKWIGEQLVLHAPVLTGKYRNSFRFYADGKEIAPGAEAPAARQYYFIASVPYARKIERGHSDQAPNGVFEVVAADAVRRFGNLATIRFGYRTPEPSTADTAKARRVADRESRSPAIVITLR